MEQYPNDVILHIMSFLSLRDSVSFEVVIDKQQSKRSLLSNNIQYWKQLSKKFSRLHDNDMICSSNNIDDVRSSVKQDYNDFLNKVYICLIDRSNINKMINDSDIKKRIVDSYRNEYSAFCTFLIKGYKHLLNRKFEFVHWLVHEPNVYYFLQLNPIDNNVKIISGDQTTFGNLVNGLNKINFNNEFQQLKIFQKHMNYILSKYITFQSSNLTFNNIYANSTLIVEFRSCITKVPLYEATREFKAKNSKRNNNRNIKYAINHEIDRIFVVKTMNDIKLICGSNMRNQDIVSIFDKPNNTLLDIYKSTNLDEIDESVIMEPATYQDIKSKTYMEELTENLIKLYFNN